MTYYQEYLPCKDSSKNTHSGQRLGYYFCSPHLFCFSFFLALLFGQKAKGLLFFAGLRENMNVISISFS